MGLGMSNRLIFRGNWRNKITKKARFVDLASSDIRSYCQTLGSMERPTGSELRLAVMT